MWLGLFEIQIPLINRIYVEDNISKVRKLNCTCQVLIGSGFNSIPAFLFKEKGGCLWLGLFEIEIPLINRIYVEGNIRKVAACGSGCLKLRFR